MKQRWIALAAVLVLAVLAAPAAAQDASAKVREARGRAFFKVGKYEEAVVEWKEAYDLSKKPLLLFNIGLARLKQADRAAALAAFQDYLTADPGGEGAAEARQYVVTLMREIADEPRQKAAARAQIAAEHVAAGRHAEAVAEYEAAYAVWPEPDYLFQIGEAHRARGDKAKALELYARYLAVAPQGARAAEARTQHDSIKGELSAAELKAAGVAEALATLAAAVRSATQAAEFAEVSAQTAEQVLAAVQANQPERAAEATEAASLAEQNADVAVRAAAIGGEAAKRAIGTDSAGQIELLEAAAARARQAATRARRAADESKRLAALPAPVPTPAPSPTVAPSRGRRGGGLRIAGLVSMGVGVVLIGGGVYFGLQASSASDEVSDATTWSADLTQTYEDGESAQSTMYILYGVGGAALIGGGVLYLLGRKAGAEPASPGAAIAPAIGPHNAGVVLRGSF